jgi:3-hydroxybutyryl-CoA dehydrogenase
VNIEDIKRILVLGAGTMGHQIGFLCALNGYDVVIYDADNAVFQKAEKRIDALADRFIKKERLSPEKKAEVIKRIVFKDKPAEAAEKIDFVTESVPEDPALKTRIFKMFHELCPAEAIFTTNTSTLIPSLIADSIGRPEKFLAFHFHDVALSDVVDIMPHPGTSRQTIELVKAFAEKIKQVPIVLKKENFGYVFNAMLSDLFKSALTLAANDVASVEDIDRAWMGVMRTEAGPFGIMDSVGLDTVWKICEYWAQVSKKPQNRANADFLKKYVNQDRLGRKTNQGIYDYPDPLYQAESFIRGK